MTEAESQSPACARLERELELFRKTQAGYAASMAAQGLPTAFAVPRPKLTLIKGGKDG